MQQFESARCRYANRGCTTSVWHEVLLFHHEECGFTPVRCSNDGCEETVNRQDLARHERESCDFRRVTCEDCTHLMNHREYGKHPCVLRKEIDRNRNGLAEIQNILRQMQEEQLYLRQNVEMLLLTQGLAQLNTTPRRQDGGLRSQGNGVSLPNTTQRRQSNDFEDALISQNLSGVSPLSSPVQMQPVLRDLQIVVAGGGSKSYEVFNWSTQQWTLYENALFFDHDDGFSFVYDSKIMICGGTRTNRIESLDMQTNPRTSSALPMFLPDKECGKGVLYGDKILTFGDGISATHLKPPYNTEDQLFYIGWSQQKLSSYGVACVNESTVAIAGGYKVLNRNNERELTDAVRIYNPNTKQLKQLAPLPYNVVDMAVLAYKDNVIILGGKTEYGTINDVIIYNITSQHCSKLPSMLKARSKCAAVIMGDKIIAIGGVRGDYYVDITEYLVLGENTWKELPAMQKYRSGATACVLP